MLNYAEQLQIHTDTETDGEVARVTTNTQHLTVDTTPAQDRATSSNTLSEMGFLSSCLDPNTSATDKDQGWSNKSHVTLTTAYTNTPPPPTPHLSLSLSLSLFNNDINNNDCIF